MNIKNLKNTQNFNEKELCKKTLSGEGFTLKSLKLQYLDGKLWLKLHHFGDKFKIF